MKTVPLPSFQDDGSCEDLSRDHVQALRDVLRRDEPFDDEAPMLEWFDVELDPLPELSDDQMDALAGWKGGASW
jgi:hypothetical protein